MVIHNEFVWGHIPRTGGDATASYFTVIADYLPLEITPQVEHRKHDTFAQRGLYGRILALNIRRLPSFMLSYIQMCIRGGIYPEYRPLPPPTVNDVLNMESRWGFDFNKELPGPLATLPDRYIEHFTDKGQLVIDRWLRMEHLVDDLLDFVSRWLSVDNNLRDRLLDMPPVKIILPYNHDVHQHWSLSQISRLYENNPIWAGVEAKVYGNILSSDANRGLTHGLNRWRTR